MKILFTASLPGNEQYSEDRNRIIDILQKNHIEVLTLDKESYSDLLEEKNIIGKSEAEIYYMYIRKAISLAQAVIVDANVDSFKLGHETTLSLVYNKPVLCLSSNNDYSDFIKHPNFFARQYSSKNDLDRIINTFIREVKHKYLSVRFNGYLSPKQKHFLDWYADKYKKNTSEIIRDLIDKKISESDDYTSFYAS